MTRRMRWMAAGTVLGFGIGMAQAAVMPPPDTVMYTTDFVGDDGDQPDGWNAQTFGSNTAQIISNRYELRRIDSGGADFARHVGDYEFPDETTVNALQWTDYRIDSVVRMSSTSNTAGLIIRHNSALSAINNILGYHGRFLMVTVDDVMHIQLRIIKDFSNSTGSTGDAGGTLLGSGLMEGTFAGNTDYRFSFEAEGNRLMLSLSDMDENWTHSLTVYDNDDPYLAGRPGMRHRPGGNDRWTAWDSATITAIPEPGVLVTSLLGAIVLHAAAKRRHAAGR